MFHSNLGRKQEIKINGNRRGSKKKEMKKEKRMLL